MRPRRLSIRGLRSYRQRVELDFSGSGLMAIVGDTGAGKSSILEAITYAVYNGTTWNQRDVRSLISDGCQTMSVELDFEADGRVYRVMRSTSRSSYPPPVHRLEDLSDAGAPPRDGEEAVNAEIERLIGMDWKGFLAAVILPQGRFQALLMATPADRTRILKGIFRLDEIERVREIADAAQRECFPLLAARQKERARYRADPLGDAARAEREAERHSEAEVRLRRLSSEVKAHLEEAGRARADAAPLVEKLDLLQRATRGSEGVLSRLLPAAGEIRRRWAAADARKLELIEREGDLDFGLRAGEEVGAGLQDLEAAFASIEKVERELGMLAERRAELEGEAGAIAAAETELAGLQRRLPELVAAAEEAGRALEEAERLHQAAQDDWKLARQALPEVRRQAVVLEHDRERLEGRREALARKREEDLAAAEEEGRRLEQERRQAQAHLEHVVRAGALSLAAQGLSAGDPCPICERSLPEDFSAPATPDVDEARREAARAAQASDVAAREATRVVTQVGEEERAIGAEQDRIERSRKEQDERLRMLAASLPAADLEKADEQLLAGLVARGRALEERLDVAKTRVRGATEARVTVESEVKSRRKELGRRREELERKRARTDESERAGLDELARLPATHRPDPREQGAFEAARNRLRAMIGALQQTADQLQAVQRDIQAVSDELARLASRWEAEVERPRQRAVRDLDALRPRVSDCLQALGLEGFPDVAEGASLAELVEWAGGLEERAREVVALVEEDLAARRLRQSQEEGKARALLQEHGYQAGAELEEAVIDAAARVRAAVREGEGARADVEPAAELDRLTALGEGFVANLGELCRLLTDGQFIGHVVERRQKNLLAVASEIMGSMTGQRYGFSADFRVVDRASGQPRPTRTLSGGESFLASLALALGLVEMAARAGGKLDALFLDEGFGSLDSNSLDEAMSALERHASSGQLVAVVSHIKAVAERIETVLRVTRTPLGSEVSFVKGSERESYMEEEVEAGLLR